MTNQEIKSLRSRLDLTQKDFAKRIGVHKMTVSAWERGKMAPRGLALKALERLAKRARGGRMMAPGRGTDRGL